MTACSALHFVGVICTALIYLAPFVVLGILAWRE